MHPSELDTQGRVCQVTFKADEGLARSAVTQPSMRSVVIILPQVTADAIAGFFKIPLLGQSEFLFLQAAMKAFGVGVPLRVRNRLMSGIHAIEKKLKMGESVYRQRLLEITGKPSTSDMDIEELDRVSKRFKQLQGLAGS